MITGLELYNEVADRLGWPQLVSLDGPSQTPQQRKLTRLMNRVLTTLQGIFDWPLLRTNGDMVLVASQIGSTTSGSEEYVTATQNSDLVTIQNASFDATFKDRAFQVSGDEYVYRIIDVLAPTQIQINRAWVSGSIAAADERIYTVATDRYALDEDFDRPITEWQSFFGPYNIRPATPDDFLETRRTGRGITLGDPRIFTVYGMNNAQTAKLIHFHPYPENARLLNYDYQKNHPTVDSDNDKVLYPVKYAEAIIEMILQIALRDYEDDDRVQQTLFDMLRNYNWQNNAEVGGPRLRMEKDQQMRLSMRRAFGTGGQRIDWGSYFDRVGTTGFTP